MRAITIIIISILIISCGQQKPQGNGNPKGSIKKADILKSAPISSKGQKVGSTFEVDDVTPTKTRLLDTTYKLVIEKAIDKEVFVYPNDMDDQELVPIHMNGFINTIHTAYSEHRPLELTPDAIWLLICQGASIHMNEQHDKLKKKLYKNQEKKLLYFRDDKLLERDGKDWSNLINNFAISIDSFVNEDIVELIVPTFSTTGPVETTAYQATLMNSVQHQFDYMGASGCGIPSITLLGTEEDWEKIYNDIDKFKKIGMDTWVTELKPILAEFKNAYNGEVNTKFWQGIYKEMLFYGTFNISGWVIKFFPYFKKYDYIEKGDMREDGEIEVKLKFYENEWLNGYDYQTKRIGTRDLPNGYSVVDMKFRYIKSETSFQDFDMELYAGFMGMRQDAETGALRPEISWAICKKDASYPEYYLNYRSKYEETIHENETFWQPELVVKPQYRPVYHSEVNKSYSSGLDEIQNNLKSAKITTNGNTQIEFIVTWDGKMALLKIKDSNLTGKQKQKLEHYLKNLPHDWKPAQTEMPDYGRGGRKQFHVNYRVNMTI